MSGREHVEAIMDAVNRRDFGELERLGYRDDTEFHSIVARTEGSHYTGLDGARDWAAMADDTWAGFHCEVLEVVEAAEARAVVILRLSGTARASGVPLDVKVAQVWEWREDGSLLRNTAYGDRDEAMRAAGPGGAG